MLFGHSGTNHIRRSSNQCSIACVKNFIVRKGFLDTNIFITNLPNRLPGRGPKPRAAEADSGCCSEPRKW